MAQLLLALLLFVGSASADMVHVGWDANTDQITGYKIYLGSIPNQWSGSVDVGNVTDYVFANIQSSTYFAATAYNAKGESGLSNIVYWNVVIDPATGLAVTVRCKDEFPSYLLKEDEDYLLKQDNDKVIK